MALCSSKKKNKNAATVVNRIFYLINLRDEAHLKREFYKLKKDGASFCSFPFERLMHDLMFERNPEGIIFFYSFLTGLYFVNREGHICCCSLPQCIA